MDGGKGDLVRSGFTNEYRYRTTDKAVRWVNRERNDVKARHNALL